MECERCLPSDSATRRRAACDFLQALCIFFEAQVIGIYSQYIEIMQKVKDRSGNERTRTRSSFVGIRAKSNTELVEERCVYLPCLGSGIER